MVFKAQPSGARWEGLAVCTWIVLIDIMFLIWMWARPVDWLKFLLIVLLLLSVPLFLRLAYRTWALFSLEYWVDRNAVTVSWAGQHQIIPLPSLRHVAEGDGEEFRHANWWDWPAPHIRTVEIEGAPRFTLLATRPMAECLLLDTGSHIFAISPEEPDLFLEILHDRYDMGAAIQLRVEQHNVAPIMWLWDKLMGRDAVGLGLLLGGVIGLLVLFGALMIRFPNLPSDLVVRYNAQGDPELIRSKSALFLLPGIGFMAWLVNGLWGGWMAAHDHPMGAYLLWGGAIVVEIFALMALLALMP